MRQLSDLEYLRLRKPVKVLYSLFLLICSITRKIAHLAKNIWKFVSGFFVGIAKEIADVFLTFKHGDWKTRTSFLVMGFGSIARGQVLRGLLFMLFEGVFIFYMISSGAKWLSLFGTLGKVEQGKVYDEIKDTYVFVEGDNSFKILLYGIITIIFCICSSPTGE